MEIRSYRPDAPAEKKGRKVSAGAVYAVSEALKSVLESVEEKAGKTEGGI